MSSRWSYLSSCRPFLEVRLLFFRADIPNEPKRRLGEFIHLQILFRSASSSVARSQGSLFACTHRLKRSGLGPRHRRCHSPLFLRRELEDVVGEQLPMVSIIAVKARRRRPGEDPAIIVLLEKT